MNMSLKIQMDSDDYKLACQKVQELLDAIEAYQAKEYRELEVINVPSAEMIVDLVWDCIN
jgi:hypothetical protein